MGSHTVGRVSNQAVEGLRGHEVVVDDWLLDVHDVSCFDERGVVNASGVVVLAQYIDWCSDLSLVVVDRYMYRHRYRVRDWHRVVYRVLFSGVLVVYVLHYPLTHHRPGYWHVVRGGDGFLGASVLVYQGRDDLDRAAERGGPH